MKKFKSKIVTFALALCLMIPCAFMLTACGDDHTHTLTKVDAVAETCTNAGNTQYYKCDCGKYFSDDKAETEIEKDSWIISATGHSYASTWTHNETHHWKEATCSHSTEKSDYAEHSLTNNACACGYVAVTYTVAEADWNEVFTGDYLTNGTIVVEMKSYENDAVVPESSMDMVMKSTETSMVMTMEEDGGTLSQYLVKEEDVWYGLADVSGAWYGMEMPAEEVATYTFAGSQGYAFVDKYSSFEYDEANKCYVAEDFLLDEEYGTTADYVKIYIENGKLASMEIKISTGDTTYELGNYVFSDYGTTVIEVPTWTVAPTE